MKRSLLMMLAIMMIAPAFALAQPDDDDDFPLRGPLRERLNLTESQQAEMQKLHLALQRKQTALRAKVQAFRLDIKEQYLADKPDRKAIERSLKGISDVQHEMKLNMVDHWFAVNNILTPEQQKVWKQMAGRFMDRGAQALKQRFGRGPGQGMGPGQGFGPRGMRLHRP